MQFAFMPRHKRASQLNILTSIHCTRLSTKPRPILWAIPKFSHVQQIKTLHIVWHAKVKLLASASLYHPVLPVRANGKLTFPLRGQCVKEELEKPWLERSEL